MIFVIFVILVPERVGVECEALKYKYSKFTGDDLDEVDLEDLLSKLSDLLLGSGFDNPYGLYDDDQPGHSMQSLHDAILEAILNGGMLSEETLERLLGKDWRDADDAEQRLDKLIEKIIEKLQAQGYLSGQPDLEKERQRREGQGGGMGNPGMFGWSGAYGTYFWIDPKEKVVGIFMMQAPTPRGYYRARYRSMVYSAMQ